MRRINAAALAGASLALVAGLVTTAAPAQAEITDGLVLDYKLNETSGTVVHDSSGQGHDGTVNGTAGWTGADGLAFNGSDTYIKVPDDIMSGLDSISVDFDVWIDRTMAKPYFLYGFGNSSGTSGNGYLFSTGNQFRTGVTTSDFHSEQQTRPGSSYQLLRGMWKHVTYTQTGTTGILYENGVEKARNTNVTITPGSIGGGTTTADYIGRSLYANDLYFKGRMRDFRVYDRALSDTEVRTIATGGEDQWAQAQALATANGALTAYDDTTGPVVVFPSDYTGDMDNLQPPADWTDEFGRTPAAWPHPTTVKSQLFTLDQVNAIRDAAYTATHPDDDTGYQLGVHYDGVHDRVVVQTDAPSSVTDALTAAYPGRLVIEAYTAPDLAAPHCTPEQRTAGIMPATTAASTTNVADSATKLQWQQVQALAEYNCALAAFDDNAVGAKIVFPSDHTGDINSLQKPPGWTSEYGDVPTDWPVPTTAKSSLFTLDRINAIEDWVVQQVPDDTTDYGVYVHYDGARDRVVAQTNAPSSVTDPWVAAYPGELVIDNVS
ncbi:LamG domain-containing protein [Streptomyces sp. NPDC002276]